ncbi:protein argonaute-3-like [Palaemon carinicauda]|uniref:protein argonaute-3-like n=1 Tax=Palaemon carinicauda TaxID=392227 RepID=UPI0035B66BDB
MTQHKSMETSHAKEVFEEFKNKNHEFFQKYKIGYDGMKSAVSVGVIPQLKDGAVYKVSLSTGGVGSRRKPLIYNVILKVVNKRSLSELQSFLRASQRGVRKDEPANVLQLIEIMFRHTPCTEFLLIGQNSFFSKDSRDPFSEVMSIGGDKVAQRGFFASLRPASWKDASLLMNVDVAHVIFYKEQPLLDFMKENRVISEDDYDAGTLNKLLDFSQHKLLLTKLKGLKVRVSHNLVPRTYKVIDVMKDGANTQTFKAEKDTWKTVLDYFKETYPQKKLRYPKLNVIRVAPETKTVFLPIECCEIAKGQKVKRQNVSTGELDKFLSFTAKPPQKRLNNINKISRNKKLTQNELMKDLGFSFLDKPVELTGRVLPAPPLKMSTGDAIVPFNGQWKVKDRKFFQSENIKCWAILNYDKELGMDLISRFFKQIIDMGKHRGMEIDNPVETLTVEYTHRKPESDLLGLQKRHPKLQIIMVIFVSKTSDYALIKKCGDRIIHVPTQCVLSTNVMKPKHATIGNILFKMNAKMGGINVTLGGDNIILDRPVLIMGADVNHPPASDKSATPSIAAVVGSLDRYAFKYAVEVSPQTSRQEMIENMKEMTKSLLKSFHYATGGYKPERIIMYRDGVSESQFLEVLAYELRAMREACHSLQEGYEPGITFIVVQKRHHTRFFPVNERDGVGRNKNVPPGTVVDSDVTHPTDVDFFLCSHEGIQGTSKPTHYRVLWDDNDLSLDQLQTFSYAMCHLYARCARAVSIPTPAYYAHWAAYRGKTHLHDLCKVGNKPSQKDLLEAVRMDMKNEVNRRMYFL